MMNVNCVAALLATGFFGNNGILYILLFIMVV